MLWVSFVAIDYSYIFKVIMVEFSSIFCGDLRGCNRSHDSHELLRNDDKRSCSTVFVASFFSLKGRNIRGPWPVLMIEKNISLPRQNEDTAQTCQH